MSGTVQFFPSGGRHLYVGGVTGAEINNGQRAGVFGAQLGFGLDVLALNLGGGDEYAPMVTFAPEIAVNGVGRRTGEGSFDGLTGTLRYGGAIGIAGGRDAMRLEVIGGGESRAGAVGSGGYLGGRIGLGRFDVGGTTGGVFLQGDASMGGDRGGDWHVGAGYVARF